MLLTVVGGRRWPSYCSSGLSPASDWRSHDATPTAAPGGFCFGQSGPGQDFVRAVWPYHYSKTPPVRIYWDGDQSGYAENPDNWIFLRK